MMIHNVDFHDVDDVDDRIIDSSYAHKMAVVADGANDFDDGDDDDTNCDERMVRQDLSECMPGLLILVMLIMLLVLMMEMMILMMIR